MAKQIWWVEGDVFEHLRKRLKTVAKNAVLFGSPPWGGRYSPCRCVLTETDRRLTDVSLGPTYSDLEVFDLSIMEPYPLARLYDTFAALSEFQVLYLPRTSDLRQVAKYAKKGEKIKTVHYCIRGASKAICVFFGEFDLG